MTATTAAPTRTTEARSHIRSEIQALRTAAVLGVVLFHLWPGRLTGGYAGVDVFFVISGFLITGHLAREIAATGTVKLSQFWARRVRRLLPAAMVVLAVVTLATYQFMPKSVWSTHLWQVIASSTYWENFRLTAESVDYLGAENTPSSVEHFWSLSVEEQFYLVWPLLILAAIAIARRRGLQPRHALAMTLGLMGVLSLATSIWLTATAPAAAYFVTPTRVWEFAAGGLLALVPTAAAVMKDRTRQVLAWTGWVAIAATFIVYDQSTPFPGWTALLPVAGAAAVIWAGSFDRGVLGWCAELRPVRYTGDISYSLYLVHWPLIVITPYALAHEATFMQRFAILIASFVLASLLNRFVENPMRHAAYFTARQTRTFVAATVSIAIVVSMALVGIVDARRGVSESEALAESLAAGPDSCLGAAAVVDRTNPCDDPRLDGVLLPDQASLLDDTGGAYACYDDDPGADLEVCTFGSDRQDALRVALVGNSHATSLLPGLEDQVDDANWHLDTYMAFRCTWRAVAPDDDGCQDHRAALQEAMENGDYDVILVSELRSTQIDAGDPNPSEELHAEAWKPVLAQGTRIVALADNPMMSQAEVDCVGGATSAEEAQQCSARRDVALSTDDPMPDAVELAGEGAHLIDFTDIYCDEERCPVVIGNVIAYRDKHHLTATFSRTLAPLLVDRVDEIVGYTGGSR